jgi:hypothetical protein
MLSNIVNLAEGRTAGTVENFLILRVFNIWRAVIVAIL